MTNKEILKIIYDVVFNSTYFSIRELKESGIDEKNIEKFIHLGILDSKVSNRARQLFQLGLSLSYARMHQYAFNCFDKSSDIAIKDAKLQEEIFNNSVFNGRLDHTFKYFTRFYDTTNTIHNFYLYLMNMAGIIPKEYQELLETFTIDDIMGYKDSVSDEKTATREKIIKYIYAKKASYAYGSIKRLSTRDMKTVDKNVLYLLKMVKRYQKGVAYSAFKLIDKSNSSENYTRVINLLSPLEERGKLSDDNRLILRLAKERENIAAGRKVYEIEDDSNNIINELILAGKYDQILSNVVAKKKHPKIFDVVIRQEIDDINSVSKKQRSPIEKEADESKKTTYIDEWLDKNPALKAVGGKILDQALYVGPYAITYTKKRSKKRV